MHPEASRIEAEAYVRRMASCEQPPRRRRRSIRLHLTKKIIMGRLSIVAMEPS